MNGMDHRMPGGPSPASGAATATVADGEGVAVGSGVGVAVGSGVGVGVGSGVGEGVDVDVAVVAGLRRGRRRGCRGRDRRGRWLWGWCCRGFRRSRCRGFRCGGRRRRRGWRRADAEPRVAGDGSFRAVDVPDDACKGVLPFLGGDGYHVAEAGVAKQVEANDLRLLLKLVVRERRADLKVKPSGSVSTTWPKVP